jgi:transposase-like protein
MKPSHTCPKCGSPMWRVVPNGADDPARFECFHCPDQHPAPEQQLGLATSLRQTLGRFLRFRGRRIADCVMPSTSARAMSSHNTVRGRSQRPGRKAIMQKPTDLKPADAIRRVSIVNCQCGHANSVQNVQPNDKLRVVCVGCGRSLEYQPGQVRRVSVAIPSLSLRDL